jgi:transposase
VHSGESVVPASELAATRAQIAQLQRMLGKKTMEAEIFRKAVEIARAKKWIARSPLLDKDGL